MLQNLAGFDRLRAGGRINPAGIRREGRDECGADRVVTRGPAAPAHDLRLRVTGLVLPGIGRIHALVPVFAADWSQANADSMAATGPLWVALGDSMSQGIGARSIGGGWVGQLHRQLIDADVGVRLVNLSVTGARVRDVVEFQLEELARVSADLVLVTVLVGANDMFPPRRRACALAAYPELLAGLPQGRTVVGTLPRRNSAALAINALIDEAAERGEVRVADMRGLTLRSLWGTRADDLFHPNERGYADIARRFRPAVESILRS